MPGLRLVQVSKAFDGTQVLDNISLELGEGELLVLLGPSGCGKSTLLRIVAGLEQADSGEIFINDRRVDQLRPRDRDIALVFQNYSLYPHMTVAKNLAFPLTIAGVKRADITASVTRVAEMLGLADRLADKPGQLSGGQRQRVALGRAIIREPALFLLDEPLSNLDADLRHRMRQEIVNLQKQLRKTMIHVTHDQTEALTMADSIALMNKGRIEQFGPPEQLYTQPASQFAASFIGQPKINIIDGLWESGRLQPLNLTIPDSLAHVQPGSVRFGIRPETIAIRPDGELSAHIVSWEYLGDHYVVTIETRDMQLTLIAVATPPEPGQPIRFSVDWRALIFFDIKTGRRLTPS